MESGNRQKERKILRAPQAPEQSIDEDRQRGPVMLDRCEDVLQNVADDEVPIVMDEPLAFAEMKNDCGISSCDVQDEQRECRSVLGKYGTQPLRPGAVHSRACSACLAISRRSASIAAGFSRSARLKSSIAFGSRSRACRNSSAAVGRCFSFSVTPLRRLGSWPFHHV